MTESSKQNSSEYVFSVGQKVCFTEEFLMTHPETKKRFEGRTGNVIGYRMGATEPIVEFPRDGRRKEQRLFEVSISKLQPVESKK